MKTYTDKCTDPPAPKDLSDDVVTSDPTIKHRLSEPEARFLDSDREVETSKAENEDKSQARKRKRSSVTEQMPGENGDGRSTPPTSTERPLKRLTVEADFKSVEPKVYLVPTVHLTSPLFSCGDETLGNFWNRLRPSSTEIDPQNRIRVLKKELYFPLSNVTIDIPAFKQEADERLDDYANGRGYKRGRMDRPGVYSKPQRTKLKKTLIDLGKKYLIFGGSWIVRVGSAKVDAVWKELSYKTYQEKLGDETSVLKSGQDEFCIFVHTPSAQDLEDIARVSGEIWKLSDTWRAATTIYYKHDVFQYLDIFSSNEYGIKTSEYSSSYPTNKLHRTVN